jgi:glycosyltransferase involved in cell wall biosynthesis
VSAPSAFAVDYERKMTASDDRSSSVSVILPARNEEGAVGAVLSRLRDLGPNWEIIVIDDGSTDRTADVARRLGATVITHPYAKGNGAAIKTGARAASGDVLVFMDADGQHSPAEVPKLLSGLADGADMVVGARSFLSHAGIHRGLANRIYDRLASWMVGQRVADLTSGFRAARAEKFRRFLYLLPNGFSYPTTITISFFRAGFNVLYVPIDAAQRVGKSHISLLRDGTRFVLMIMKIGTLYSPLKLFVPVSLVFFLTALGYYFYTYLTEGRFTNMSALLFTTSVVIFLIGLVSEQITALVFKDSDGGR